MVGIFSGGTKRMHVKVGDKNYGRSKKLKSIKSFSKQKEDSNSVSNGKHEENFEFSTTTRNMTHQRYHSGELFLSFSIEHKPAPAKKGAVKLDNHQGFSTSKS